MQESLQEAHTKHNKVKADW